MKQKGFASILIVSLVLALSALSVIVYLKQNQKILSTDQSTEQPKTKTYETSDSTPTSSPFKESPNPITTADWKTYINTKYNITFKYPPKLILIETNNGNYEVFFVRTRSEKKEIEECLKEIECYSYPLGIDLEVIPNSSQKSLEEIIKTETHEEDLDDYYPSKIDGMTALENEFDGIGIVHNVYVNRGGRIFHIFANAITDKEENMETFKQILSTLKFSK